MSLVITSNEIQSSAGAGSNYQKAFSWSNHLNQPLVLPKNCEVAVQSLKVNKDGSITVNQSTKLYVYFGVKLSEGSISYDDVSSFAREVDLGVTGSREVTVEDLATLIKGALDRGVPNPETYGLSDCTVLRNADGSDFLGFTLKFESRTNGSGLDIKPQNWFNPWTNTPQNTKNTALIFNSASNTLAPNYTYANRFVNQQFSMATAKDTPIALNGGQYTVNVSSATGCAWGVGLTRASVTPFPDIADEEGELPYGNYFVDYSVFVHQTVVGIGNFFIRVYASVYDSIYMTDRQPLYMGEIEYYNASSGGDFNTGSPYNWSTNASQIQKVRFEVDNEKVKVVLTDNKAADFVLVATTGDYKKRTGTITDRLRFPPIRDTCRNLYPFAFITPNGSNNSLLTIEKWGGRQITGFEYNNGNNDLYVDSYKKGLLQTITPIERRSFLDVAGDPVAIVQPTYKGTNASGVFQDYDYVVVLRPDNDLYTNTQNANADMTLGFDRVVRLENASKSGANLEISEYSSTNVPALKSTTSLFVRLNNLPVKSYNAGQSRRSQIIYAAPRFSTGTDQSVGGLFFESPEKTYISLDNPQPINLNTLDIDIVNENETLAVDLLGKTVCTLHFREKRV